MRYLALTTTAVLAAQILAAQGVTATAPTTATPMPIVQVADTIVDATASPGGRLIVYATKSNEIRVYDRDAKTTKLVMKTPATVVVLSPMGNLLAITRPAEGSKDVYLWTLPVDPKTALPTGEPRRVSLSVADNPRFSPDGKSIAFTTGSKPTRLMVIPATGGTERELAQEADSPVRWPADGKWIYFSQWAPDDKSCTTARVPASGGKVEDIGIRSQYDCYPGISPDGRFFAVESGWGGGLTTAAIYDSNKRPVGAVRLTMPIDPIAWLNDGLHLLATREDAPSALHSVPMAGGPDRILLTGKEPPVGFSMSPDGNHVFASVPNGWGHRRVMMNADGSNQRTVFTGGYSTFRANTQHWSPDGRYIAFSDNDQTVRSVQLFELATGKTRAITQPKVAALQLRWRADSRAIISCQATGGDFQHPQTTIHEVMLDGTDRTLFDLDGKVGTGTGCWFVGDSGVFVPASGSYGTFRSGELKPFVDTVPSARRSGGGEWVHAISDDGRWFARQSLTDPTQQTIDILAFDGKTRFTVKQPFPHGRGTERLFDHNGRNIIAVSGATAASASTIYAIPVDGSAPRTIVTLAPGSHVGEISISPDGKTLLYSTSGAITTTLLDVDLGVGLSKKSNPKE